METIREQTMNKDLGTESKIGIMCATARELTRFRRRNIGFVFQNYNLVPILNVYENIVLPVELDGGTVDRDFLDEVVHVLALEDKLKSMPNNLFRRATAACGNRKGADYETGGPPCR